MLRLAAAINFCYFCIYTCHALLNLVAGKRRSNWWGFMSEEVQKCTRTWMYSISSWDLMNSCSLCTNTSLRMTSHNGYSSTVDAILLTLIILIQTPTMTWTISMLVRKNSSKCSKLTTWKTKKKHLFKRIWTCRFKNQT